MGEQRRDRLSALVGRFELRVAPESAEVANLVIDVDPCAGSGRRVVFLPGGGSAVDPAIGHAPEFRASAQWGGPVNPLLSALPERIAFPIRPGDEIEGLADLLISESRAHRCGSGAVISRLGEVLIVRVLREQLEAGTAAVGLLAGLADARIGPAIVAMHDAPGTPWRVESLAEIAGLSVSRFSARFSELVGTTPMNDLRRWRMVLAMQDIARGERVQRIAARYGYASSETLSRAFKRLHGRMPTAFRHG